MSDALAPGKQQTMAGVANLMCESPITRVRCLTLSAEAEEAGRPTGLPKGLARDENRFALEIRTVDRFTQLWMCYLYEQQKQSIHLHRSK